MSIPYIDYSSLNLATRKPKKNDKIILYNSNYISIYSKSKSKIISNLKDAIVFIIQSNIITKEGINKEFVLIKPENPSEVIDSSETDSIFKVHVNNIRQILT